MFYFPEGYTCITLRQIHGIGFRHCKLIDYIATASLTFKKAVFTLLLSSEIGKYTETFGSWSQINSLIFSKLTSYFCCCLGILCYVMKLFHMKLN